MFKGLISIDDLSVATISKLLEKANNFPQELGLSYKPLANKYIYQLFYEPSTRTKLSFERAGELLGANVRTLDPKFSSEQKGEEFLDTLHIVAKFTDLIIVRSHGQITNHLAESVGIPMVNAGCGYEDPTQALGDLFTIQKHVLKGREWTALKVAIFGDIENSRVGMSNVKLFKKMGIEVFQCRNKEQLLKCLRDVDVVMVLRQQKWTEILHTHSKPLVTKAMVKKYNPNVFIMHPGPIMWGDEMDPNLKNHPNSLINAQVASGLYMRMAVLDALFRLS